MADLFEKDHLSHVMQKVYKLLVQRSLCDLSVCVGNAYFNLHKCIIAAACPLLNHLILQSMETMKDRSLNLVLHGIKESGFKAAVRYIYSGKIPNEKNSDTWSDFVHTCEYLSLPYPVRRKKKMSMCQPKEKVQVTLTPNMDGAIDVVLKKELEVASDYDEMDIPVESKETEGSKNEVTKSNPDAVDGLLNESVQEDKVSLEMKHSEYKEGVVKSKVRKRTRSSKQDVLATAVTDSGMSQHDDGMYKPSKEILNCCGRFLVESNRENATTCAKITYKCTDCGRNYVAISEPEPQKVNTATQTQSDGISPEIHSCFQNDTNATVEVEIFVPTTEDASTSQTDPPDPIQQEGVEELLPIPERDGVEDGGKRSLAMHAHSNGQRIRTPVKKRDTKKTVNAQDSKFLCQMCNTGFNLYKHLITHKEKCARIRKFKCIHCPLGFSRCEQWEKHLLESHNVQM